jgi:hypothetical protein
MTQKNCESEKLVRINYEVWMDANIEEGALELAILLALDIKQKDSLVWGMLYYRHDSSILD